MVEKKIQPVDCLIVAADFSPEEHGGISGVEDRVMSLAKELQGMGVYLKVNSVLRAVGYGLIQRLHDLGVRVFADLKLVDIPNTMRTDAQMIKEVQPDILTVMACAGIDGMSAVQQVLGDGTEVLGVTVLTSLNEEECQAIFSCSTKAGVLRFARMAQLAGLGGLILSPKEIEIVSARKELMLSLNCPGIRPAWSIVEGDDQSRVLTPKDAIKAGAKRIVIGRPIVKAGPNDKGMPQSPREAVTWTLNEIGQALTELKGGK